MNEYIITLMSSNSFWWLSVIWHLVTGLMCSVASSSFLTLSIILVMLPVTSATPDHASFPGISFRMLSEFVDDHFSSGISLSTVLVVLFSLTENPDLLNLHARQQNPRFVGEKNMVISGWMKALAHALNEKLGSSAHKLFQQSEKQDNMSYDEILNSTCIKLDALAKVLDYIHMMQMVRKKTNCCLFLM